MFIMLLSNIDTDYIFVSLSLDSLAYYLELFSYLSANNHTLLFIVALYYSTVAL